METQITKGIKISVQTTFKGTSLSNHTLYYAFSYAITIENRSDETVQLTDRYWEIFDSLNQIEIVSGEGVTKETGKILSNILMVLSNNPDYAKQVASDLNMVEGSTPQELVRAVVLGIQLTADDKAFQENQAREKQSKGSVPSSNSNVPTKQLDEATSSPEALKLQPFLDQGVTKEQMLSVLDSLGFAENAEKKRMISVVNEVFD